MFGSFPIGRLFGITIRIHWLWLVGLIAYALTVPAEDESGFSATFWLFAVLMLFGSVLLHELGHSLMARRFGVRVLDITLWPLGGLARMAAIPEDPRTEIWIAVAGPAVNFVLGAMALTLALLTGTLSLSDIGTDFTGAVSKYAVLFAVVNIGMGAFNLVPAFPMDGGRVLRALLGAFSDWLTATRRAVTVGKTLALLMFVTALITGWWSLGLVAFFVWIQGAQELFMVRLRHGDIPGMRMNGPKPTSYSVERPPPPPREEREPDESGARRPSDNPLEGTKGQLSDEDIAKLEGFRGRLRGRDEHDE